MPRCGKTRHTKEAVIAAVEKRKGKLYLAAADLAITTQTLRNYAKRWPAVQEAIHEAKGKLVDIAEDKLADAVERGEAWAVCFTLKTQGKDRGYSERFEHRHGGDGEAPPISQKVEQPGPTIDYDRLTLEQQLQLLELTRLARTPQEEHGSEANGLPNGDGEPTAPLGARWRGSAGVG